MRRFCDSLKTIMNERKNVVISISTQIKDQKPLLTTVASLDIGPVNKQYGCHL
jgi:hypothetical protein